MSVSHYCLCDRLIFHQYHQLFRLLQICKNIFYQAVFLHQIFKNCPCTYKDKHLCFKSTKILDANSLVKYLKSFSDKFLTSFSRLQFISCILSVKTKFLFKNIPCIFLIYLELRQFSHQICEAYKKLNDCHNLLNCEILQELF